MTERAVAPRACRQFASARLVLVLAGIVAAAGAVRHWRGSPSSGRASPRAPRTSIALYAVSGLLVGALVGLTGRRRRLAHDAPADASFRLPPQRRGRHRPTLRLGDQDGGRRPCIAPTETIDWGIVGSDGARQRTGDAWRRSPPSTPCISTARTRPELDLHRAGLRAPGRPRRSCWCASRCSISPLGDRCRSVRARPAILTVTLGAVAGRADHPFLGGRRRDRRHRAGVPLSEDAGGADRRLRHRPCRAADADRRRWPLGAGFGELSCCWARCWWARSPASSSAASSLPASRKPRFVR